MATTETVLVTATINLVIAGAVGFGLYKVISVKGMASTASDYGREWLAWMVFFSTLSIIPFFLNFDVNFSLNFDAESFAKWIIIVVLFGAVAFVAGWIYGKIFGKKQQINHDLVQGESND